MRGLVVAVLVGGCFAPSPPPGAPCTTSATCPGDLVCSPATFTCEHAATPADVLLEDALDDAMVDAAIDAPIDAAVATYAYRRRLTIQNNTNTVLPVGFTIRVLLPFLPQWVSMGKVRTDFADLRVIGDAPLTEVDRIVDGNGPGPTALSFALAKAIPANGMSTDYAIYYGRPTATAPPADGTKVFALYDPFTTTLSPKWTVNDAPMLTGGNLVLRANHTDAIVTTAATDGIPITSAIELSARVVDPQSDPTTQGTDSFYYWFGYQRTGDFTATDPWVIWVARSKATIHAEQLAPVGCEAGCGGPDVTQNTSFHYYVIQRDPTMTRFFRDGTLSYSTAVMNTTDYSVIVRNFMATSNVEIDYVRARARVSPDPTANVGAEEPL